MKELENKKARCHLSHAVALPQSDPYLLPVTNISRKSGVSVVDLRFLRDWLGSGADRFLESIRRNGRRYIAAQTTYSSRHVLRMWAEVSVNKNWTLPSSEMPAEELLQQLSGLREIFFQLK